MARVKVKVVHDCEKPNMIERTEVYPARTFWNRVFNTGRRPHVTVKVKAEQARWTCSCGSEWEWLGLLNDGFWMCLHRPNEWEWKEV